RLLVAAVHRHRVVVAVADIGHVPVIGAGDRARGRQGVAGRLRAVAGGQRRAVHLVAVQLQHHVQAAGRVVSAGHGDAGGQGRRGGPRGDGGAGRRADRGAGRASHRRQRRLGRADRQLLGSLRAVVAGAVVVAVGRRRRAWIVGGLPDVVARHLAAVGGQG